LKSSICHGNFLEEIVTIYLFFINKKYSLSYKYTKIASQKCFKLNV